MVATGRALRADAQRNVQAILDAAQDVLTEDPHATIGQIAQAAGVGRVTLYGHFQNRAELVDAVFEQLNEECSIALDTVDTGGDPIEALTALVSATWRLVHRFHNVLRAARAELGDQAVRRHHDVHHRRLTRLIAAGQRAGVFRTDLPRHWLMTTYYSVVHAAADDCATGRLRDSDAAALIVATLVAAFTPTGHQVPPVS